jgi:hypothetical protein
LDALHCLNAAHVLIVEKSLCGTQGHMSQSAVQIAIKFDRVPCQPQSGERMQPTAQAAGGRGTYEQAPKGRQKRKSRSGPRIVDDRWQRLGEGNSLAPLRGLLGFVVGVPRLAPWAVIFRRFAAGVGVAASPRTSFVGAKEANPRCISRHKPPCSSSETRRTPPGTNASDDVLPGRQYIL